MDVLSEVKAIEELLVSFGELNPSQVEQLSEEPSPLEFMRYVARNTPFVVRAGAAKWKATRKWDADYLKTALSGQTVNVAVTPKGNADAPTYSPKHDAVLIAKPHEEDRPFSEFLGHVQEQDDQFKEVWYAQTQNDNLRNEYQELYADVEKDIPFARIALQRPPDAINLWIGNGRSVTCLHKDPMENIYVQIRGRKHFTLLPPLCHPCTNEQLILPATYVREASRELSLEIDQGQEPVPLATWDPDHPEANATKYSHLVTPLRVTLEPGDMLYLPAMWYHKVAQSCIPGDEGFVLAVNYWYDMDFSGPLYPLTTFVRNIGLSQKDHQEERESS